MTYDAVIFDLDGVLLTGRQTSDAVYQRATAAMLGAYGKSEIETWPKALDNPDSSEEFANACETLAIPAGPAWGYRERTATQYESERIASGERAVFDDATALHTLSSTAKIGIVSNNRHCLVAYCVDTLDWGTTITAYRGRYPTLPDYDRMKPDPTYLAATIDQLNGDSVLFVGDRRSDVLTANRVGCDSALLSRDGEIPAGNAEPTVHITTLHELVQIQENGIETI